MDVGDRQRKYLGLRISQQPADRAVRPHIPQALGVDDEQPVQHAVQSGLKFLLGPTPLFDFPSQSRVGLAQIVGALFDEPLQLVMGRLQGVFGPLPLRDVYHLGDEEVGLAFGIADQGKVDLAPKDFAALVEIAFSRTAAHKVRLPAPDVWRRRLPASRRGG